MDTMVNSLLAPATGSVRLKLFKGTGSIAGRRSDASLYEPGLASFGAAATYDHADAAGFIKLFGLPTRVAAARELIMQATRDGERAESDAREEVLEPTGAD
jgi:argininosuccinate synthase